MRCWMWSVLWLRMMGSEWGENYIGRPFYWMCWNWSSWGCSARSCWSWTRCSGTRCTCSSSCRVLLLGSIRNISWRRMTFGKSIPWLPSCLLIWVFWWVPNWNCGKSFDARYPSGCGNRCICSSCCSPVLLRSTRSRASCIWNCGSYRISLRFFMASPAFLFLNLNYLSHFHNTIKLPIITYPF